MHSVCPHRLRPDAKPLGLHPWGWTHGTTASLFPRTHDPRSPPPLCLSLGVAPWLERSKVLQAWRWAIANRAVDDGRAMEVAVAVPPRGEGRGTRGGRLPRLVPPSPGLFPKGAGSFFYRSRCLVGKTRDEGVGKRGGLLTPRILSRPPHPHRTAQMSVSKDGVEAGEQAHAA
ncbi:hypothetical protein GQ53DRAFT_30002 [Thozetella sp. PMI_491]|nr:hypothetical protein GQ53DRAFT_30002 [Thozetella sp. PMI_491]